MEQIVSKNTHHQYCLVIIRVVIIMLIIITTIGVRDKMIVSWMKVLNEALIVD